MLVLESLPALDALASGHNKRWTTYTQAKHPFAVAQYTLSHTTCKLHVCEKLRPKLTKKFVSVGLTVGYSPIPARTRAKEAPLSLARGGACYVRVTLTPMAPDPVQSHTILI